MKRLLKITMTRIRRRTLKVPMVFMRVQCPECGCDVEMHAVPADKCADDERNEQNVLMPVIEDDNMPVSWQANLKGN